MAKAICHCHSIGIIHRDVKMENFLLDYEETTGGVLVQLSDFGLATYQNDVQKMK